MTAESWAVAAVVLVAVLAGAAIPALVQLRATLRATERTLQRSGARLDEALGVTSAAAGRIDALVARLEKEGRIEELVDGVAAVSRAVAQLRDTVRIASAVGAAVGPAVAAAVHAFRDDRPDRDAPLPSPLRTAGGEGEDLSPQPRKAMP